MRPIADEEVGRNLSHSRGLQVGHAPQGGVNVEVYTKFDLAGLTEAVQKVTHGTVDSLITNGATT